MIEEQYTQEPAFPPEAFVEQVKQTLANLYDFPYLQHHPLAQEGELATEHPSEMPGRRLRRELIAAIEALNPGPSVPFRAPHARLYNLLHLRYVEGMTVQEAAHEVGLSLRQAYRDLRRGEENVAAMLWARRSAYPPPHPQEARATRLSSVQVEMARLETHSLPTDVRLLLRRTQESVGRLAQQQGVGFHAELPPEPVIVSVDPAVAQQVLVNTLSQAVQQTQPGVLHLELMVVEEQAFLTLRYSPKPGAANILAVNHVVTQLVNRLGWTVRQDDRPDGTRVVTLCLTIHGPTVLVVDDNEGLVNLLERYLTDQACQVIAATSGREGLRLAREAPPDAIVLDVMMPEMDGWELLQRLRTYPQTANIPVIICSVFDDPELAYSLGASLFLRKPVSRASVLKALCQLGVV